MVLPPHLGTYLAVQPWIIRRLKKLNHDTDLILDFYLKEIRPVVEHGAPIWTSGLTKRQIYDLERIQKTALKIIFGKSYIATL